LGSVTRPRAQIFKTTTTYDPPVTSFSSSACVDKTKKLQNTHMFHSQTGRLIPFYSV